MLLSSFAKLNLYLRVLNKRRDGYHSISTLFERISLCDKIFLKSRRDKLIKITCSHPDVPLGAANLCYQSARLLQRRFGLSQGVEIKIIKRIPVGAGLGGGSSNAANVLMGLNQLWKLHLSQRKLGELAKEIGSDVAFFIFQLPFAQGSGRGEKIKPLKDLEKLKLWHLLAVPKTKVPTPFIYKKWDSLAKKGGLTTAVSSVKITTLALVKKDLSLLGGTLFNSLQQATVRFYPEVGKLQEALRDLGAKAVLMSGSGPAVFALCASQKEALSLSRKLKAFTPSSRIFVVSTA